MKAVAVDVVKTVFWNRLNVFDIFDGRAHCQVSLQWNLLLIFVQSRLQQTEGVDEAGGEAHLLTGAPFQADSLHAVFIQVELLLRLFADQLSLETHKYGFKEMLPAPTDCSLVALSVW